MQHSGKREFWDQTVLGQNPPSSSVTSIKLLNLGEAPFPHKMVLSVPIPHSGYKDLIREYKQSTSYTAWHRVDFQLLFSVVV